MAAVGYARGAVVLAGWLTQEPRVHSAVLAGVGIGAFDHDNPNRRAALAAFRDGEETTVNSPLIARARVAGADFRNLYLQLQHLSIPDRAVLEQITVPVYVVAGKEDHASGNPGRLEELFPNGKMSILPGDHATTFSSVVFGAATMAFLKQQIARPAEK